MIREVVNTTPFQKPLLLYLYGIDLVLVLIAVAFDMQGLRYVSKPLLMILLVAFVASQQTQQKTIKILLIVALVLSLAGDCALLGEDGSFFMLGLAFFLIAHLFYIYLFLKCRQQNDHTLGIMEMAALVAIYVTLALINRSIASRLGALAWPVLIYSCVIITMLIVSLRSFKFSHQPFTYLVPAGAALFVVSDFLLALNKFALPFPSAGILVMLTYALAQLFITTGVIKFTHSIDKH